MEKNLLTLMREELEANARLVNKLGNCITALHWNRELLDGCPSDFGFEDCRGEENCDRHPSNEDHCDDTRAKDFCGPCWERAIMQKT